MRGRLYKKSLVLAIIVLFVILGIFQSVGSISIKKQGLKDFVEITESITRDYDKIYKLEIDNFSLLTKLNSYFMPGELIVKFKEDITFSISDNNKNTLKTGIRSLTDRRCMQEAQ